MMRYATYDRRSGSFASHVRFPAATKNIFKQKQIKLQNRKYAFDQTNIRRVEKPHKNILRSDELANRSNKTKTHSDE